MVLKAWPKLNRGNYSLKIYGSLNSDKSYAEKILRLASGQKNIKFCGTFSPESISEIYANIDILIIPSRWFENAPLVLRNALHTKTPIVGVNIGSIPELVKDGTTGLLYENESLSDLINKLNQFIKNPSLMSKNIDGFPKQKSIDENANELLAYYQKLITHEDKK
jgi:glycosyltransferase involved in cell wall biosynthesis